MAWRQPGSFGTHYVHQVSNQHPRFQQQQQYHQGWGQPAPAGFRPMSGIGDSGVWQDIPTPQPPHQDVRYPINHSYPTSFGHDRGGFPRQRFSEPPNPNSLTSTRFGLYPSCHTPGLPTVNAPSPVQSNPGEFGIGFQQQGLHERGQNDRSRLRGNADSNQATGVLLPGLLGTQPQALTSGVSRRLDNSRNTKQRQEHHQPGQQQRDRHQPWHQQQERHQLEQESENRGWQPEENYAPPFSDKQQFAGQVQVLTNQQQLEWKPKSDSKPTEVKVSRSGEGKTKSGNRDGDNVSAVKRTNRKNTPETSWTDQKKALTEEMRQSVREMFPNMRHQVYCVPPTRTNKTKYRRVDHLSSNKHEVKEQCEIQLAAVLGDQTEETITHFIAEVIEIVDEPMFHFSNYTFDDYLFHMDKKGGKAKDDQTEKPATIRTDQELSKTPSSSKDRRKTRLQGSTREEGCVTNPERSERDTEQFRDSSGTRSTDGPEHQSDSAAEEASKVKGSAVGFPQSANDSSPPYKYLFPSPRDLDKNYRRGDFDNLIFSPRHGFIVIEAKTMRGREADVSQGGRLDETQSEPVPGMSNEDPEELSKQQHGTQSAVPSSDPKTPPDPNSFEEKQPESVQSPTDKEALEDDFRKTIRKSLDQLRKAEVVLRYLTSDLPEVPQISKVLALPNTPAVVLRCLLEDLSLRKECFEVLETSTLEETLARCITAELVAENQPSAGRDATAGSLTSKLQWWRALVEGRTTPETKVHEEETAVESGDDDKDGVGRMQLSWDVYEQIVSRFCGIYSRVPSRTAADCVHLTGVNFGSSILHKDQLSLFKNPSPFFFLNGPPGSGKTLLLALKAADWVKQGDHVVVICMKGVNTGSLVSWTLYDRVVEAVEDFKAKEKKKRLAAKAEGEEKNAQGKRSAKKQHKRRGGQNKASVCTPHELPDIEPGETRRTPAELETRPTGPASSATASSLNSSPRIEESLGAVDLRAAPEHPDQDCLGDNDVMVNNVQKAFITAETDVDKFVTDLLAKYDGTRVRFIVDECLRQSTEDYVFNLFSSSQGSLERMKTLYRDIMDKVACGSNTAWQSPGRPSAQQERQECVSELDAEGRATSDRAKDSNTARGAKPDQDESRQQKYPSEITTGDSSCEHLKPEDSEKKVPVKDSSCECLSPSEDSEKNTSATDASRDCISPENSVKNKSAEVSSPERLRPGNSDNIKSAKDSSCDRLTPNDSEKNATGSDASGKRLSPEDYFVTMDDRMNKLTTRFTQLHAGSSGGPRLLHSIRWRHGVDQLSRTFLSVKELKTQAAHKILGSSAFHPVDLTDSLEELGRLMVSVMGNMFLAYNSLNFFQLDQLFSTARSLARDPRSNPQQIVSVWGASFYPGYCPAGYERGTLVSCIRCPPTLQKILKWTEKTTKNPPNYTYVTRGCDADPPLPSDGPPVTWFDHAAHMTSSREVNDCATCGKALVDYLCNTLGLRAHAAPGKTKGKGNKGQAHQNQLYFHDVIICGSPIHQPDCAFIRELKQSGITLQYESQSLTSPPPYIDKVFVVGGSTAQGLEAKIVVYVPELKRITAEEAQETCVEGDLDGNCSGKDHEEQARLRRLGAWNSQYLWQVASRSLSQLVIFHI